MESNQKSKDDAFLKLIENLPSGEPREEPNKQQMVIWLEWELYLNELNNSK